MPSDPASGASPKWFDMKHPELKGPTKHLRVQKGCDHLGVRLPHSWRLSPPDQERIRPHPRLSGSSFLREWMWMLSASLVPFGLPCLGGCLTLPSTKRRWKRQECGWSTPAADMMLTVAHKIGWGACAECKLNCIQMVLRVLEIIYSDPSALFGKPDYCLQACVRHEGSGKANVLGLTLA